MTDEEIIQSNFDDLSKADKERYIYLGVVYAYEASGFGAFFRAGLSACLDRSDKEDKVNDYY